MAAAAAALVPQQVALYPRILAGDLTDPLVTTEQIINGFVSCFISWEPRYFPAPLVRRKPIIAASVYSLQENTKTSAHAHTIQHRLRKRLQYTTFGFTRVNIEVA